MNVRVKAGITGITAIRCSAPIVTAKKRFQTSDPHERQPDFPPENYTIG
jgi:hypothetical protein